MGEFGLDDYAAGTDIYFYDFVILTILFCAASFMLLIHLLNMLIAIMGETFAANNETKDIKRIKSHLYFVLKVWHYLDFIPDKDRIRYLISATIKEEERKEYEILEDIKAEFKLLDLKIEQLRTDNAILSQQISKQTNQ